MMTRLTIFRFGLHFDREERFRRLFEETYPRLVRYAQLLMEDGEEARDLVGDVMEQAWEIFDTLQVGNEAAWLYTATRNACLNRLKHLQVAQEHIDRLTEATEADARQGYREHEALLQQAERIADELSEPTRTILRLCYWERKTYKQVAEQLGISPDTVKKHISKALRILREAMKQKED